VEPKLQDTETIKIHLALANLLGEIMSWASMANAISFAQTNNGDAKCIKQLYLFV